MTKKISTTLILTLLISVNAFAHEYWFEPETFFPALKQKTAVHLYVGDGLIKDREERIYQSAKTPLFDLFSNSKKQNLKPDLTEGQMPVFNFTAEKTGNYLLAMERDWAFIKIESGKFEDYLREDGMEYIIAEREKLGESEKEGRERYSRYIKSLLQVGDKRDKTYKKQLGMKLEITPLENPYAKKIGDELQFQIVFEGKPLADRTIFADNRSSETQKMTTDKNGIVTMKIDNSGLWLVRLVNMRRCAADCGEADWESFWGAFSFGVK